MAQAHPALPGGRGRRAPRDWAAAGSRGTLARVGRRRMTSVRSREVHLVRRPQGGTPQPDDVTIETVDVEAGAGQVLVRNTVMSVEPYMRGRMSESASYVDPYELGAPMEGHATGVVQWSDVPDVPVGSVVVHPFGWRDRKSGGGGK